MKAIIVIFLIVLGGLFFAIGLCGVTGFWSKFLFISLTGLFNSPSAIWLFVASLVCWFFAGVLMRRNNSHQC